MNLFRYLSIYFLIYFDFSVVISKLAKSNFTEGQTMISIENNVPVFE